MITSGVLIPSLVRSVVIIDVIVVLVDSIVNDVVIGGVLILFNEVITIQYQESRTKNVFIHLAYNLPVV